MERPFLLFYLEEEKANVCEVSPCLLMLPLPVFAMTEDAKPGHSAPHEDPAGLRKACQALSFYLCLVFSLVTMK